MRLASHGSNFSPPGSTQSRQSPGWKTMTSSSNNSSNGFSLHFSPASPHAGFPWIYFSLSPAPSIFSPFQIGCSNFLPQPGPRKPRPVSSVAARGSTKLEGEKIPPWMDPGLSSNPFLLMTLTRRGWCMLASGALVVAWQMRGSGPSLIRAFVRSPSLA